MAGDGEDDRLRFDVPAGSLDSRSHTGGSPHTNDLAIFDDIDAQRRSGTRVAPSNRVMADGAAATGVAVVILLYIALQIVSQGVLGPSLLGNTPIESVVDRFIPGGGDLIVLIASVSRTDRSDPCTYRRHVVARIGRYVY